MIVSHKNDAKFEIVGFLHLDSCHIVTKGRNPSALHPERLTTTLTHNREWHHLRLQPKRCHRPLQLPQRAMRGRQKEKPQTRMMHPSIRMGRGNRRWRTRTISTARIPVLIHTSENWSAMSSFVPTKPITL